MKINSSTIKIENQDYKTFESVIEKIAKDNSIDNVESVHIKLSSDNGIISFKLADIDEAKQDLEQLINVEEQEDAIIEQKKKELDDYLSLADNFFEIENKEEQAIEDLKESLK